MLFKTSLDKTAIGITVFITVLFVFIIGIQYLIIPDPDTMRPLFIAVILLLIYCLAFAFHPAAYKITSNAIIVCRPLMNVYIQRANIKKVALIDQNEIKGAVRTFGIGGLFGYYGCFANYTLGSMTWYATRKDNAVLITTSNNKKIVITPNQPEAFIAAMQA